MLALIWNAISGNRITAYVLFAVSLIAVVVGAYTSVKNVGASEQRSKQLSDALSSLQKEFTHRAEIDRMSTDDARRQLRERWSRR